MIKYHISYQYPHQHFIDIKVTFSNLQQATSYLQLPAWRPGRYELANFAKNIQQFNVFSDNKEVAFRKITKDRWEVDTKGLTNIEVRYNYYASQLDAGSSWLDAKQLYINFINCLVYLEGATEQVCQVELAMPENYQIACGLPEVAKHTLEAKNYHQLVDSPMMASASLKHQSYEVNGIPFHIWIQGDWEPDWESLLKEFKAFTANQIEMMGDFPEADYHFLFQMLPYKFYHGVEHRNSTVIVLGPDFKLYEEEAYQDFLSVSSHELFHAWNICKIRPTEMMPYDYTQENYFSTGFVVEGITSYMGDVFLVRSGVWRYQQYFKDLNKYVKRHFENFGRYNHSLTDSSWDLWLDGYSAGIPNRKVSIYAKGAMVALILDLKLRLLTQNKKSLDTVMQLLWQRFGKQNKGYTLQDYQQLAEEVAEQDMSDYFVKYIHGKEPLEQELNVLLEEFGCSFITKYINKGSETFSFQTAEVGGVTFVSMVIPKSNASKLLSMNDEIVAIDGRKVESNLTELLTNKNRVRIHLFRNKELVEVTLEADEKLYFCEHIIQFKNNPSPEQQENFQYWLKG